MQSNSEFGNSKATQFLNKGNTFLYWKKFSC